MPAGCFNDATCADICLVESAPRGELTISARLWTAAKGCSADQCMCLPDSTGRCQFDSPATVSGMDFEAAPFSAGADTAVDLAF